MPSLCKVNSRASWDWTEPSPPTGSVVSGKVGRNGLGARIAVDVSGLTYRSSFAMSLPGSTGVTMIVTFTVSET